jgi:hypothetical protein
MPGGDRTGPMGMGPRTGRGAGYCGGAGGAPSGSGFTSRMGAAFLGRGRGRGGRGRRNMFYATGLPGWMRGGPGSVAPAEVPASEAERQSLQDQMEALQSQLDEVKRQLAQSDAAKTEK